MQHQPMSGRDIPHIQIFVWSIHLKTTVERYALSCGGYGRDDLYSSIPDDHRTIQLRQSISCI